jgi:putative methyltransferase (TIGR04325 family)
MRNLLTIGIVKSLYRNLTPPIFVKMLHRFLNQKIDSVTYEGVFESFEAVIEQYGNQPNYSTVSNLNEAFNRFQGLINCFRTQKEVSPDWSNARFNFFGSFISGLNLSQVEILDVGGGFGETFLYLKKATTKRYRYHIVEISETLALLHDYPNDFSELTYSNNLNEVKLNPQVIYFGSSLQYFEDYSNILIASQEMQPEFIVISDTAMGEIEAFVCAQVNMRDIVIPRWVFNEREIISILKTNNYELVHQSSNYYPFHNFNNYEEEFHQIQHRNLIFWNPHFVGPMK